MKKFTISLFSFLVLSITAAIAQRPVIELTFTAEYNNIHVPLDSILIQNLTQPGDTMLYAPDTLLLLDYSNDIPDYQGNVRSSFSVSPNYPNPSADGKTSIDVFIHAREIVTMRVFDIIGNEVAFYENTLDAGNHHFTFLAGKEKYYVLSVNCRNEIRSVKMINSGKSPQNQGRLIYEGSSEMEPSFKSQNEIAGFDFSLGDQLRFIGYAKSPLGFAGSDVIEAIPEGNENSVFEILEGLPCPDIPTVTYEGQTYKTVKIGYQCWFKENMNVGTRIDGFENQTNNGVVEKYCYGNDPANCEIYGGLYQWDEMMRYSVTPGIRGICPPDWHLPTDAELTTLTNYLGYYPVAGGKMKTTGTIEEGTGLWYSPNTGATNESGFSGLPGGNRASSGDFEYIGYYGFWWSSTEYSSAFAWLRNLYHYLDDVSSGYSNKDLSFSVRCLKDASTSILPTVTTSQITNIIQTTATGGGEVTFDGGAEVTERGVCWSTSINPTIADNHTMDGTGTGPFVSYLTGLTPNTIYFVRAYATNIVGTAYGNEEFFTTLPAGFCGDMVSYEGQNYNTIQVGTQCWFKENLNVGTMIDGTQNQTNNGVIEKYCYDNDPVNCEIYGGLYQWDEMMQYSVTPGIRGICPPDWHLPTDEEWTILTDYISSQPVYQCGNNAEWIAKALASSTNWNTSTLLCAVGNNQATNNATGFTGLPGGYRDTNGSFSTIGIFSTWWSSSEYSSTNAWTRLLGYYDASVESFDDHKEYGYSVRCLKDN